MRRRCDGAVAQLQVYETQIAAQDRMLRQVMALAEHVHSEEQSLEQLSHKQASALAQHAQRAAEWASAEDAATERAVIASELSVGRRDFDFEPGLDPSWRPVAAPAPRATEPRLRVAAPIFLASPVLRTKRSHVSRRPVNTKASSLIKRS